MSDTLYDVLVIGEGVSGLTAAQCLARNGARTATFEAQLFGGLIINVNALDPSPAEPGVSGAEYAAGLVQQNAELGVESVNEAVTAVHAGPAGLEVETASGIWKARNVVLASGARLKRLGVPGEAQYEGRGVSQCADCDGPMYQGEAVVVVGGGDSALQEALVLAEYCDKVHLVHRRDRYRARENLVEHVQGNPKIAPVWNATVSAISGDEMVKSATLRHSDGRSEDVPCAGVFAYIGLEPNTGMLAAEVKRDPAGCVDVNGELETSMRGLWAIGAARSGYGGTLPDAIDDARRVAEAIGRRLT